MKAKDVLLLILIVGLGIASRLLFALFVPTEQLFDFATYLELARNISNGYGHTLNGVPVAWQGPLYPFALGYFFRFTGMDTELAGKILNFILSSLTLLLSVDVYRSMFSCHKNTQKTPKRLTIAAVAITAFLPANIAYINVLGTEVLFVFLLMLIMSLVLRLGRMSGKKVFFFVAVIGLFVGLSALTKPFMLIFPLVLALVFWFQTKRFRKTLVLTGIVIFGAALAVAPWTMRNYRGFERFIPISYNSGYVLFINNNDNNHSGLWMDLEAAAYGRPDAERINAYLERAGEGGIKAAHELGPLLTGLSIEWILNNFGEFLQLGFLRVHATFFGGADDVPMWAMNTVEYNTLRDRNAVYSAFNVVLTLFAAVAFIFAVAQIGPFFKGLSRKREAHVPSMLFFVSFAFFVAVIFVFEGQARYAFPVYPMMIYAFLSTRKGTKHES